MAAARGLGRREKMRVPRGIRLRVQIGATGCGLFLALRRARPFPVAMAVAAARCFCCGEGGQGAFLVQGAQGAGW